MVLMLVGWGVANLFGTCLRGGKNANGWEISEFLKFF